MPMSRGGLLRLLAVLLLAAVGTLLHLGQVPSISGRKAGTSSATLDSSLGGSPEELAARKLAIDFVNGDFHLGSGGEREIGVCAATFGEGRWLREWVLYHLAIGFTKFYIYDQDSQDGAVDLLAPFISAGIVVFHTVTNQEDLVRFQASLVNRCYADYGTDVEWLAHFDIDEFVTVKPAPMERSSLIESGGLNSTWSMLWQVLSSDKLKDASGVMLSRYNFINLGYERLDDASSLLASHLYHEVEPALQPVTNGDAIEAYRWTKALLKTNHRSREMTMFGGHEAGPLPGKEQMTFVWKDALGRTLPQERKEGRYKGRYWGKMDAPCYRRIFLSHYLQRDVQDCYDKAERRQKCCPNSWRAKVGKKWCKESSAYVSPEKAESIDLARFTHDPVTSTSFAGRVASHALSLLAAAPPDIWITQAHMLWAQKAVIRIDYDVSKQGYDS